MPRTILVASMILLASPVLSADAQQALDAPPPTDKQIEYSPYPKETFPNQVFFGDAHLHTSYSTDAGMAGNTLGPDEAYRFAKGQVVTSSTGLPAQLERPLDFLVVADHAENLGLATLIEESDRQCHGNSDSTAVRRRLASSDETDIV